MAAPLRLTKGTKQYYPITVTSALGALSTLDTADLRFDIYKNDDDETVVDTNLSADNDGMLALPLVDTTSLDEGEYKLFINFVALPEEPRLGPFYFVVGD